VSRVLVAGGAGFVGSHLVDRLLDRGDTVVVLDNFSSGRRENLAHRRDDSRLTVVDADIVEPLPGSVDGSFDAVLNLASPASPVEYLEWPIETLNVGSRGTQRLLDLALANEAVFLITSTSEVYGDPLVHPQPESYWGNVNPTGPRSVYDESKRFAEALTAAYQRRYGLEVRIARLFNTYGPRLRPEDGRVVSNFIAQALSGRPLTIYGDGSQTRSFGYVDDTVEALIRLLDSEFSQPINIGNPAEFTMLELAELVSKLVGSDTELDYRALPEDDPMQRQPDISLANRVLGWSPKVDLVEGLGRYIDWMRAERDQP
jgi:dTDP-glucose 4,6-dehydratase